MEAAAYDTPNAALRTAEILPLDEAIVIDCLDVEKRPRDELFARAFADGLAALQREERRGVLGGVTGHVAESIVDSILAAHEWIPVWHFAGPGQHGVDLLMLGPGAERMFAIEVKGTLRPAWPRLRRAELPQMDIAWLDKSDNPGMQEWGVTAADLFGAVATVSFNRRAYRLALTPDFKQWRSIVDATELDELDWLDGTP